MKIIDPTELSYEQLALLQLVANAISKTDITINQIYAVSGNLLEPRTIEFSRNGISIELALIKK